MLNFVHLANAIPLFLLTERGQREIQDTVVAHFPGPHSSSVSREPGDKIDSILAAPGSRGCGMQIQLASCCIFMVILLLLLACSSTMYERPRGRGPPHHSGCCAAG
jgi:hypothetical protein